LIRSLERLTDGRVRGSGAIENGHARVQRAGRNAPDSKIDGDHPRPLADDRSLKLAPLAEPRHRSPLPAFSLLPLLALGYGAFQGPLLRIWRASSRRALLESEFYEQVLGQPWTSTRSTWQGWASPLPLVAMLMFLIGETHRVSMDAVADPAASALRVGACSGGRCTARRGVMTSVAKSEITASLVSRY